MPGGAKRTAKKAAKATSSAESSSMLSWLSKGKKSSAAMEADESKAEEEDPIVESPEKVAPPVKRPKRGSLRAAKKVAAEESSDESESQMEGIEPFEMSEAPVDLVAQLDEIQSKAAAPIGPAEPFRVTRNNRFRTIPAMDEATSALLHQYHVDDVVETDDLLNEVLGISSSTKVAAAAVKGRGHAKRTSSRIAPLNVNMNTTHTGKGPDLIDILLKKQEEEENYTQKLAQVVGNITSGNENDDTPADTGSKVTQLDNIETAEFSHETTYLVVYFAPLAMPKLASFIPAVPFEVPSDASLAAITANTEENQEIFNRLCSTPGAILKLSFLKALLRKLPCPIHVAEWLVQIMLISKVPYIALEAYDILLDILPSPPNGWGSRISKNNHASPPASGSSSYGLPFVWNYHKIAEVFNLFGAGQMAAVVTDTGEKTLLQNTVSSLPRLLTGRFDSTNLMKQLEHQAASMTDEVQAAALAHAAEQLQNSLASSEFNAHNFSLIILHWAAAFKAGLFSLTQEELIITLVGLYRASVDPSCQAIIPDLQEFMFVIYEILLSLVAETAIPRLVHDICEALWQQVPEAQKTDFHATYFRWTYLTPCSSKPMRAVRSAMAMVFLKALAAKPTLPLVAPPEEVSTYKLGDPLVTLPEVIEFLTKCRIDKDQHHANWPRYSNWILLIDLATACFDATELPKIKRTINQWDTAFTSFHSNARERGTFNLSLARFKDLATHAATKMRVINNSVAKEAHDAFASFRVGLTQ